ncbi:hypothetical protein QQ045_013842 [Rhodiola kirilowii]
MGGDSHEGGGCFESGRIGFDLGTGSSDSPCLPELGGVTDVATVQDVDEMSNFGSNGKIPDNAESISPDIIESPQMVQETDMEESVDALTWADLGNKAGYKKGPGVRVTEKDEIMKVGESLGLADYKQIRGLRVNKLGEAELSDSDDRVSLSCSEKQFSPSMKIRRRKEPKNKEAIKYQRRKNLKKAGIGQAGADSNLRSKLARVGGSC